MSVSNMGTGSWTSGTAWHLREDLRLGSPNGEPSELFSQIAFLETDQAGNIYVLDYPAQEVRVFSAGGEFLRTIGGRGFGPGEFSDAYGMAWDPQGRLWVIGARYSVFERSGKLTATHRRMSAGSIYPWPGGFLDDGRLVEFSLNIEIVGREQVGVRLISTYSGKVEYTPQVFDPVDESVEQLRPLEFWMDVTQAGQIRTPSRTAHVIVDADGHLWLAQSHEYRLVKRTLEGDTALSVSMPSSPMRVPEREMDSIVALSSKAGRPFPRERFSKHRRLLTRLAADGTGHLFVLVQEEGVPEGSAVDVFRASGEHLGRMTLPERFLSRAVHVTPDHFYGVVLDDVDIPYVVRYRIVKP